MIYRIDRLAIDRIYLGTKRKAEKSRQREERSTAKRGEKMVKCLRMKISCSVQNKKVALGSPFAPVQNIYKFVRREGDFRRL